VRLLGRQRQALPLSAALPLALASLMVTTPALSVAAGSDDGPLIVIGPLVASKMLSSVDATSACGWNTGSNSNQLQLPVLALYPP
jgi:hypothetical protein